MSHYYSKDQDSISNERKIKVSVKGLSLELWSDNGIFSKDRLDTGTRELLENCIFDEAAEVLDLGCGNGVVGVTLKKLSPGITIDMVDVNERAVELAKKNSRLYKIEADIYYSDIYSKVKKKYDVILSNPPQTAGREVCFRIIEEASSHLKKDGTLQLVARHNKGGSVLEKKMKEVFGNVETVSRGSGFRVYLSINNG